MKPELKNKLEQRSIKDGDFILPGVEIATVEEFIAGKGTHVEGHTIRSSILGTVRFDPKRHTCWIESTVVTSPIPKADDLALAQVGNISRQMATLNIFMIGEDRVLPTYTALMHISQVTRSYLNTMDEALRPGDVVRCKIVDAKTIPLQVETVGTRLGVVYSNCEQCGAHTHKKSRDLLVCPVCGTLNRRATAVDYGTGLSMPT